MFYREKAKPQPWEEWTSWWAKRGGAPSGWTRWQSEKLRWSSRPWAASCRRSCPISALNYLQKVICFIKSNPGLIIPLSSILNQIMYQICAELSVNKCLYIKRKVENKFRISILSTFCPNPMFWKALLSIGLKWFTRHFEKLQSSILIYCQNV